MPKVKPYRAERFGIMNHVGGIWSPENFETEAQAQAYLDEQRREMGRLYGMDLSKHHVAKMRLTLSVPQGAPDDR